MSEAGRAGRVERRGRSLRWFPLAPMLDRARSEDPERASLAQRMPLDYVRHQRCASGVETARSTGRGRPRLYDDAYYEQVAAIYTAALSRPNLAVAAWASVSPSAAAKQVARARELGFRPATTKGRRSQGAAP